MSVEGVSMVEKKLYWLRTGVPLFFMIGNKILNAQLKRKSSKVTFSTMIFEIIVLTVANN